jgi:hypothetical protein
VDDGVFEQRLEATLEAAGIDGHARIVRHRQVVHVVRARIASPEFEPGSGMRGADARQGVREQRVKPHRPRAEAQCDAPGEREVEHRLDARGRHASRDGSAGHQRACLHGQRAQQPRVEQVQGPDDRGQGREQGLGDGVHGRDLGARGAASGRGPGRRERGRELTGGRATGWAGDGDHGETRRLGPERHDCVGHGTTYGPSEPPLEGVLAAPSVAG